MYLPIIAVSQSLYLTASTEYRMCFWYRSLMPWNSIKQSLRKQYTAFASVGAAVEPKAMAELNSAISTVVSIPPRTCRLSLTDGATMIDAFRSAPKSPSTIMSGVSTAGRRLLAATTASFCCLRWALTAS